MSIPSQTVARCCRRASSLRVSPSYLAHTRWAPVSVSQRWNSTEAAPEAPANPKITQIVDQISQLTLLETADLVSSLKTRLNIPDLPVGGFAAAAAPNAAAATPPAEEDVAPAPQEKTLFNLKIESIDAGSKPKIIKEIKSYLGLSLVDSKKFVEAVPKVLKESVPKEEGEKLVETMKNLGAKVVME